MHRAGSSCPPVSGSSHSSRNMCVYSLVLSISIGGITVSLVIRERLSVTTLFIRFFVLFEVVKLYILDILDVNDVEVSFPCP